METSLTIDLDENSTGSWGLDFKIKTSVSEFTFYIPNAYLVQYQDWIDFITQAKKEIRFENSSARVRIEEDRIIFTACITGNVEDGDISFATECSEFLTKLRNVIEEARSKNLRFGKRPKTDYTNIINNIKTRYS